jgi:hypothetical protein
MSMDYYLDEFNHDEMISLFRLKCSDIIKNYEAKIEAQDTHRWCECDGYYELQFLLILDAYPGGIYLHTVNGNQELEDKWSDNNPQEVDISTVIGFMDEYDIAFALSEIDNFELDIQEVKETKIEWNGR